MAHSMHQTLVQLPFVIRLLSHLTYTLRILHLDVKILTVSRISDNKIYSTKDQNLNFDVFAKVISFLIPSQPLVQLITYYV